MSLAVKESTVLVEPFTQDADVSTHIAGNRHGNANPQSVVCSVQIMSAGDAFREFGIDTTQVARVLMEVSDASKFGAEYLIQWSGSYWTQRGPTSVYAFGTAVDHAEAIIVNRNIPVRGQ